MNTEQQKMWDLLTHVEDPSLEAKRELWRKLQRALDDMRIKY